MSGSSTLFLIFLLLNYFVRFKVQIISRNETELNAVPKPFHGQLMATAVKMAVKTSADLIFFEQFQDLGALIALISRRVMEKYQLLPLPCRPQ